MTAGQGGVEWTEQQLGSSFTFSTKSKTAESNI
jgi:hypothetical protein